MPYQLQNKTQLDTAISRIAGKAANGNKRTTGKRKVSYEEFLSDKMLIIQVIGSGIPYAFFELIQKNTPFNELEWAHFMDIHVKSLQRYREANTTFKPSLSEKIIALAEVTNLGSDVFGDMDRFKLWLDTPNFALGSTRPIELMKTSYGKELIMGELTRINYGILA